jgi:hypothetical protein
MSLSINSPSNQQGSILVTVMVIMVLAMGLVAALIEHFAVAEARAVEESLAKVRVYWGMSGMVDYALSRVRNTPTIVINDGADNDNDTAGTKISLINDFFDELDTDTGDNDGQYRFTYDTNYMFDFTGTTLIHTGNTNAANGDGRLTFTINLSIPTPNTPSLTGLDSRTPDLAVDLCAFSSVVGAAPACSANLTAGGEVEITSYQRAF